MLPSPKIFNNYVNPEPYDRFLDLINSKISSKEWTLLSVGDITTILSTNKTYVYKVDTMRGAMIGSSWGRTFSATTPSNVTTIFRICQHAYPSLEMYNASFTRGDYVVFTTGTSTSSTSFTGLNRNGYTSGSYGATIIASRNMIDFVYYDPFLDMVMHNNPYTMSSPIPYNV